MRGEQLVPGAPPVVVRCRQIGRFANLGVERKNPATPIDNFQGGHAANLRPPVSGEQADASAPPLPECPQHRPQQNCQWTRAKHQSIAVQGTAVAGCRYCDAVLPASDDAHRATQGAARIDLHPHAVSPVRVGEVDQLLTQIQPSEHLHAHRMDPRVPGLRKAVVRERLECDERSPHRAKDRRTAKRPPRGIRWAVENKFQKYPHPFSLYRWET
jgi:hypothetical protein